MVSGEGHVTTQDIHEYLSRRSQLCDSRIEEVYMRLSQHQDYDKKAVSSSDQRDKMSVANRKARFVDDKIDTQEIRRPSPTQVKPHGILKKTQSPTGKRTSRAKSESPDAWFQRIMHVRKLSPLDLCEAFCYGDSRKHKFVALSHVCEVLFDLDPESVNGMDPVTEEMEDFLYKFVMEERGEIVVDIREALRALDIWQSRVTSSKASTSASKRSTDTNSKAVMLESKNKKLMGVISSLQDANLRLSQQLEAATLSNASQPKEELPGPAPWSPKSRTTLKTSSIKVSPVKVPDHKRKTFAAPSATATSLAQVVDLHEKELVDIADKLEYSGVLRLEELLKQGDHESTGFVNLRELWWVLSNEFQLEVSEVLLVEICMGMTFNSQAQLDYKEFVDVLFDILLYALPNIRDSAKKKILFRLDQYFASGFQPGREDIRQLLDALCSKYDRNRDGRILVQDLFRVFQVDLVKQHALTLPFPLDEREIVQVAQPFIDRRAKDNSRAYANFPGLLDALLGTATVGIELGRPKQTKRALQCGFWRGIRFTLCGSDISKEKHVLSQVCKIFDKVDPKHTFTVSRRYFRRIFGPHVAFDDMAVLEEVLSVSNIGEDTSKSEPLLRYDVLLKLVFGSPQVNGDGFLEHYVQDKLVRERDRVQTIISDIMTTTGAAHKLEIQDFYDIFIDHAAAPLSMVEMLLLFASVDGSEKGWVTVKKLQDLLAQKCWNVARSHASGSSNDNSGRCDFRGGNETLSTDIDSLKTLLMECFNSYDIASSLEQYSHKYGGWISLQPLILEIDKMFHQLGVNGVERDDLDCVIRQIIAPDRAGRIHLDTFLEGIFDWERMIQEMRLPHSLVEVKKAFETFDCDHVDVIYSQDWNRAWGMICRRQKSMKDWEIRALQRRFPGKQDRDETIDYSHLLVYLLDHQQRQSRQVLYDRVMAILCQKFTTKHGQLSTAAMEKLFHEFDADGKGHFNVDDLKRIVSKELAGADMSLLENSDALVSVMQSIAGGSSTIVTFERFRELAGAFTNDSSKKSSVSKTQRAEPVQTSRSREETVNDEEHQTVSSLRVFELKILEIVSKFADLNGNILPSQAFQYLSVGPTTPPMDQYEPMRSSFTRPCCLIPDSPTSRRSPRLSATNRSQQREVMAATFDPLAPARLKQLLETHHHLDVSTHLITQFFLHIGSPSKHFLDLPHFAQWAAPLSMELMLKVREIVRQMIIRGKGGGGSVDLDRFLAMLQRRLRNSPRYMTSSENMPLQFVPASLLLSTLHQLNIMLQKQELFALLRHFGMEGNPDAVDYALLLQRLYELNTIMTTS